MNIQTPGLRIIATSLRLLASRSAIVVLALVAIAAVWSAAYREVQISRERELQDAHREAENYARAFEEHIGRTLQSVDSVILTVIRQLGRADMAALRRELGPLHEIHQNVIAAISVIDARGDLISGSPPAEVISLADRPHFRVHVDSNTGKPFIGQPLLGRVSQKWSMHVSRRVNAANGSFAGAVVASIDLDYLKRFYRSIGLGKDDVVELIGSDGIVRVRSSDDGISAGQDASGMKLFQELRGGSRLGTYSAVSPVDGVRRIVSYRVVEGHPLVVTVNLAERAVLDRVRSLERHYYLGAGGMTLLLATMFASGGLMLRRQRRIGMALERSEQRLSLAQEGSEQALFDWNIVTGEVYLSERWSEMMGGERSPVHTTFSELARLVHPDDFEGQRAAIVEALKGSAPYRREHRIRTRSGEWIWIQSHGKVTARDAQGRALRMVGYNSDITPRKTAQLALAGSEERFRATFENAPVGIMHTTIENNRILQVNPKLCEMLGYTRDELLSLRAEDILHPDYRGTDRSKHRDAMLNGERDSSFSERVFVQKDGSPLWVDRTVSLARDAAGKPLYFIRIVEDITGRKEAESERARLAMIVENASDAIIGRALDGTITSWNAAAERMFGYTRDEIVGKSITILVPEGRRNLADNNDKLRRGEEIPPNETIRVTKDGRIIHVQSGISPIKNEAGDVIGAAVIVRDISERKQSEVTIIRERALLRTIIDAVPDFIYVKDAEGRFSVVNRTWLKERNLSDGEVVGKTVFDVFPDGLARRMAAQDAGVMRTGIPIVDFEQRVVVKTPEGELALPRWFSITKVPMRDASGTIVGTIGTSRDITERKISEQRREMEHAVTQVLAESAAVDEAMPRLLRTMCQAMNWSYGARWMCTAEGIERAEFWADFEPEFDPADRELWFRQGMAGSMILLRLAWQHKQPTWIVDIEQHETFRRRASARKFGLHGAFAFPIIVGGEAIGLMEFFGREARQPDEILLHGVRAIGSQIGQFIQRKETERALREAEEQFRQLAGNIPQVFWICDAHRHRTVYISSAFREITGLDPEMLRVRAHGWLDAVHPDDRQQVVAARKEAASGNYDQTFRIVKPDGQVRWVRDRAFPVYDANGSVYRIAGICEDITEKKAAEVRLSQLAHFDILTGLPNRALFLDRMRQAMTLARRHDRATGVMFLDLDRFKLTNDTFGHSAGDQLLKQVGARLADCVREGDTVGRFGGDEFGIVLADMRSPDDARVAAQKTLDALQMPFELESHEVFVTASIGISLYPADSDDEMELMKNADTAMYRAKESGRNRYEFYSRDMNTRSLQRLTLESNLRRALERGEFLLHYQPKASLTTLEITGFEALLRWAPGGQAIVSPAEFVPLLEDTGLIVPVGEWVVDAACRQLVTWREAGVRVVPVAVNLSARQFRDRNLAANIERILRAHDIEPRFLEIEITESSLMMSTEEAVRTLSHLKALGLRICVDDFGTGYSSLAYLRRFPLDTLKIDRSFVNEVTTNADGAIITRAVIGMSQNLGLRVVAEGVETAAQLEFLYAAGCGEMQGYYFSRPLPAGESLRWLRQDRRLRGPVVAAPERKRRKQQR